MNILDQICHIGVVFWRAVGNEAFLQSREKKNANYRKRSKPYDLAAVLETLRIEESILASFVRRVRFYGRNDMNSISPNNRGNAHSISTIIAKILENSFSSPQVPPSAIRSSNRLRCQINSSNILDAPSSSSRRLGERNISVEPNSFMEKLTGDFFLFSLIFLFHSVVVSQKVTRFFSFKVILSEWNKLI